MVHDQPTPAKTYNVIEGSPGRFLILVGVLWLLLASILLVYLLLHSERVELTWETATEQNTAGFNVYRSDNPEQGFILVNTERIISSQGDPTSGALYAYVDDQVTAGETYYYVLEEVELNGSHKQHLDQVFEYAVPEPPWRFVVIALVSAAVGSWMIVAGMRQRRRQ